jgi:hypothetical protein
MTGRVNMAKIKMPHPFHEHHLCFLQNIGLLESSSEIYKRLIRNPKFVCRKCGRAAVSAKSLCEPEKL